MVGMINNIISWVTGKTPSLSSGRKQSFKLPWKGHKRQYKIYEILQVLLHGVSTFFVNHKFCSMLLIEKKIFILLWMDFCLLFYNVWCLFCIVWLSIKQAGCYSVPREIAFFFFIFDCTIIFTIILAIYYHFVGVINVVPVIPFFCLTSKYSELSEQIQLSFWIMYSAELIRNGSYIKHWCQRTCHTCEWSLLLILLG